MRLVDTHAHLDDEQFDHIREEVLARAAEAGVEAIVIVGTTAGSSEKAVRLAESHAMLLPAVGIQPNYCAEAKEDDWSRIVKLASHEQIVALGETGLDRYWDYTPFDMQQDYFRRHIRLSQESGLPFIVHMRDCGDDIVQLLEEMATDVPFRGVMHSFTGDLALAERCLELGLYISFAGMVTYKKSDALRQVASHIPDDRILIETDAPYLSPHPKRGQRPNEPSLLVHTAACLAECRQQTVDEFAELTTVNARRFLRL